MPTRHLCLLAGVLVLVAAPCGPAWAEHRKLDRSSPLVRSIHDRAVPGDMDTTRVLAAVLGHAHDPGAPYLHQFAVYEALAHLAGDPPPPRPPKVEHAILEMHSADGKLAALRARILDNPVRAEVLKELDPALEPRLYGWRYRHDGASIWTREDGGDSRVLGVRVVNHGTRDLSGGQFTLHIEPGTSGFSFTCNYGALAVRAETRVGCAGQRSIPAARLLAALEGGARIRVEHESVTFPRGDASFEVKKGEAGFRGVDLVAVRAEEMIAQGSCSVRGSCGSEAGAYLKAEPGVLGLLLGLAAGMAWLAVRSLAGRSAGRVVVVLMSAAVGIAALVMLVTMFSSLSGGHPLLVLFLGVLAGGKVLELVAGFGIGLLGTIALVSALRKWRVEA